MSERRKGRSLLLLLVLVLISAAVASERELARARSGARARAQELATSRRLAREIEALRGMPERAKPREILITELTGEIERAVARAKIPPERLVRIEPEAPRRLGESAYREKPTRVELRRLRLEELTRFLYFIRSERRGLWVRGLRLQAPHGEVEGKEWLVELSLSYLVYAPTEDAKP